MRTLLLTLSLMFLGQLASAEVVKPSMDEDLSFSYQPMDSDEKERGIAGSENPEVKEEKPKVNPENKKHNVEDEIPLRAQRFWKY